MREKLYKVLQKIYGILMTISFFAGFLPLIVFIAALCIGGDPAQKISVFLYEEYYKWVVAGASCAVVIGLVAMYIGKKEGLSVKSVGKKSSKEESR